MNQGINNITLNETISCKKGYMILLRNVLSSNQSQIIVGEKVSNNLYEDLKIISKGNVSLSLIQIHQEYCLDFV